MFIGGIIEAVPLQGPLRLAQREACLSVKDKQRMQRHRVFLI